MGVLIVFLTLKVRYTCFLDNDCQNSKNLLTVSPFSRGLFFTCGTDFDLDLEYLAVS